MISIDFNHRRWQQRLQRLSLRRELIARAAGIKASTRPTILDVTAGLGEDGFVLASFGCEVTLIERSATLAQLLAAALTMAPLPQRQKMTLIHADSLLWLTDNIVNFDVIYLDPMYPERNKTALNKLAMREIRDLVGEDNDASQLCELALTKATKRVVVKRPRLSQPLIPRKPDIVYEGKSIRFDVYLTAA
jgi:16S rRNA (guanine1516-N2)-methyltransferase